MKHLTYKIPLFITDSDVKKVVDILNNLSTIEAMVLNEDDYADRILDIECSEIMTGADIFRLGMIVGQTLTNTQHKK